MRKDLLCCDWGTSSFRLRLVQVQDQQIIGEVVSSAGIASTFDAWKSYDAGSGGIPKEVYFRQQLQNQIAALAGKLSVSLAHLPVVISGMASSSIGLEELPYAELPFAVDGSQASVRHFAAQPGFPHEIVLISGICNRQDVMRGEETQLIGLVQLMNLPDIHTGETVFIFPGTHSKHIKVRNHQIIDFQTFMTGEIFNLLSQHSILKDSIEIQGHGELSEDDLEGFSRGLRASGTSTILHTLFTVRTNQLFNSLTRQQNFYYLSGLLIGTELRSLLQKEVTRLVLSSGSNLYKFYKLAIEELDLADRTVTIPPELIDKAAIVGQISIFQHQELNNTGTAP